MGKKSYSGRGASRAAFLSYFPPFFLPRHTTDHEFFFLGTAEGRDGKDSGKGRECNCIIRPLGLITHTNKQNKSHIRKYGTPPFLAQRVEQISA